MKHLLLASLVSLILAYFAHANPGPSPKPSSSPPVRPASPRVVVQVTPPRTVHVHTRVQSPATAIRWVYHRSDPHMPWVCYGGFYRSAEAHAAANYFRALGRDAFVR